MSEDRASWQQCMAKLEHIHEDVAEIKVEMKKMNGTVRCHDRDLAILKDWRLSQGNPAVQGVQDLKVELAKFGVFGGGAGFIVVLAAIAAKVLGVM